MAVVVEAVTDTAAAVVNADGVALVSVVVDATVAVVVVDDVTEVVDVSVAVDVHLHKRDFFPASS